MPGRSPPARHGRCPRTPGNGRRVINCRFLFILLPFCSLTLTRHCAEQLLPSCPMSWRSKAVPTFRPRVTSAITAARQTRATRRRIKGPPPASGIGDRIYVPRFDPRHISLEARRCPLRVSCLAVGGPSSRHGPSTCHVGCRSKASSRSRAKHIHGLSGISERPSGGRTAETPGSRNHSLRNSFLLKLRIGGRPGVSGKPRWSFV